jgi:hypothetical protein
LRFISDRHAAVFRAPRCADNERARRMTRWRSAIRLSKTLHFSSCSAVEPDALRLKGSASCGILTHTSGRFGSKRCDRFRLRACPDLSAQSWLNDQEAKGADSSAFDVRLQPRGCQVPASKGRRQANHPHFQLGNKGLLCARRSIIGSCSPGPRLVSDRIRSSSGRALAEKPNPVGEAGASSTHCE